MPAKNSNCLFETYFFHGFQLLVYYENVLINRLG